jgi:hypothetical protein
MVIAFPDTHPFFQHCVLPDTPERRAERLLRSLLTSTQLEEWLKRRKFLVQTKFGTFEFGELYNIRFWPNGNDELRLYVVPTQNKGRDLPLADQWTNLLLALRSDPERFLTVATWRKPEGHLMFGPVPGFGLQT